MSLPRSASGMTRDWMGNGVSIPRAASASHTASGTPRERKVFSCLNSFGRRDRASTEETATSRERGPSAFRTVTVAGAADETPVLSSLRELRTRVRVFEQPQAVLELCDAELELVPLVARDEAELARDVADAVPRPLPHAQRVAAPARRHVLEQRPRLVEARAEQREEPLEPVALGAGAVTGGAHVASTGAAGAGARASPPGRRPAWPPRSRSRRGPRESPAPSAGRTPARAPSTSSAAARRRRSTSTRPT